MIAVDKDIRELIEKGILQDADPNRVQNIVYDTKTLNFYDAKGKHKEVELKPNASVFVGTVETISLPNDMVATIKLRNRYFRQGLTLDAPVYQPGHKTRIFYRVTNISNCIITLKTEQDDIASIMFEKLDAPVEKPYHGASQYEFDFKYMENYSAEVLPGVKNIEEKLDQVKRIEERMYGNVIALMTVFIGVFSLINVNVGLANSAASGLKNLFIFNCTTIGAVTCMAAIIQETVYKKENQRKTLWIVAAVAFGLSIFALCVIK